METYTAWIILIAHISILLGIDFFVLYGKNKKTSHKKALFETIFFVANALIFSAIIYWLYKYQYVANVNNLSPTKSVITFITGYLVELSLSVDNLFVIAIIFTGYKIPIQYQHRLLFLGILGAILFRAILIGLGLVLMLKIQSISILFGLFLLYTAFRMLKKGEVHEVIEGTGISRFFKISNKIDGSKLTTHINGKRVFTALFGALITIELTDIIFALDSIPAILAITKDPFLVYSSNIFAVMGLRSMYFFLSSMLAKFQYLKYSVFAILIFVSVKLITDNWVEIPEWFSLLFIGISLGVGVWISVIKLKTNG